MQIKAISKQQTNILKGVAIFMILCHNFFHWVEPMNSMENEFVFSVDNIIAFFNSIIAKPTEIINILFSYFGHFGVQIFIFISGYGLAMSFKNKPLPWGRFVVDRLKKIYPLLVVAILFFILARYITDYRFSTLSELRSFGYKLLFLHTFIPGEGESVNGPWWFFGLIIQLYLLFHVVYYLIKKYNIKAFIGICCLSYLFIYLSLYTHFVVGGVKLMHNAIGHLPEFSLGVLFAQKEEFRVRRYWAVIALVVFCLGNYFKIFFPFTFLCVTYLLVSGLTTLMNLNISNKCNFGFWSFVGKYSMALFAVHGFYRWQFVALAKNEGNAGYTLLMALVFLINAFVMAFAADAVYKLFLQLNEKISDGLESLKNRIDFRQNPDCGQKFQNFRDKVLSYLKMALLFVFSMLIVKVVCLFFHDGYTEFRAVDYLLAFADCVIISAF
ncbi:MAG: acyltransferase, partial [Bacteroidales bacterium]|nr:acyltransferase [Bacteroidales bacterium]